MTLAAAMLVAISVSPPRWLSRRAATNPHLESAARAVQLPPPADAPRAVWSAAWTLGKRALPLLHAFDDTTDTNVNLIVLWLKALAGLRRDDGVDDDGVAFAMLPPVTRRIISRPLCHAYPRLHHQNIALRTAFLDKALSAELARCPGATVCTLGAGFDGRCLRFREANFVEIDLPHVIQQKRALLARVVRRRPKLAAPMERTRFYPANLTSSTSATSALRAGLEGAESIIFLCEALLIYLPSEAGAALLRMCVEEAQNAGSASIVLCFADSLPGVERCDMGSARLALEAAGFQLELDSWTPKPGLARHMGVARAL